MEGILKRVCLFTLCAIIIRPPKVRVKSPIEIENLLDHTAHTWKPKRRLTVCLLKSYVVLEVTLREMLC